MVYHSTKVGGEYGAVIVIAKEGPAIGQLTKAHSIDAIQFQKLRDFKILD